MLGVFGIFQYALGQGHDVETSRTMVVNTIVVMETAYLFNVRYLRMTSFSLVGAMGTPAVLAAVAAVVAAQLVFTSGPFMHDMFDSAPVALLDGLLIIGIGVVTMVARFSPAVAEAA